MKEDNIKEWLNLSNSGHVAEAEDFYYKTLFTDIIDGFCERTSSSPLKCNVLFSILGYSPEPIILTQRALKPEVHIIFTTNAEKSEDATKKINGYLSKYLTSEFEIVEMNDDSFFTIYQTLKEQMTLFPSSDYVIDITGGKKSMVASAAIFGRDYNCSIVYVDYDEYLPTLRKPKPGTERLNLVYSPILDLPEIRLIKEHIETSTPNPPQNQPQNVNLVPKKEKVDKKKTTKDILSRIDKINSAEHRKLFGIAYEYAMTTIERETGYTSKVRLHYSRDARTALFESAKGQKRLFTEINFRDAYGDYYVNNEIKDINTYNGGRKLVENAKQDFCYLFMNIIECIDEYLHKKYKRFYK